jgi:hypothetical protein
MLDHIIKLMPKRSLLILEGSTGAQISIFIIVKRRWYALSFPSLLYMQVPI